MSSSGGDSPWNAAGVAGGLLLATAALVLTAFQLTSGWQRVAAGVAIAAGAVTFVAAFALLIRRRPQPAAIGLAIGVAVVPLTIGLVVAGAAVPAGPPPESSTSTVPSTVAVTTAPAPTTSSAPPTTAPNGDVRIHDVWATSPANDRHVLRDRRVAAVSFRPTLPYLRSVEVGAGPPGAGPVTLHVFDENHNEIEGCQKDIEPADYRVKCTFDHPLDVRPYQGQVLYLALINVTGHDITVYSTTFDKDPSVTYLGCLPAQPLAECRLEPPEDLDALIVGRASPDGW